MVLAEVIIAIIDRLIQVVLLATTTMHAGIGNIGIAAFLHEHGSVLASAHALQPTGTVAHLEHVAILDGMVPASLTLLERDHLLDVRLLLRSDVVQLRSNFVLAILTLQDQAV